jgi:hypothetical protein
MSLLGFFVVVLLLVVVYLSVDENGRKFDNSRFIGDNDPLRKRYSSDEKDKRV